jgi:hypothetical protein
MRRLVVPALGVHAVGAENLNVAALDLRRQDANHSAIFVFVKTPHRSREDQQRCPGMAKDKHFHLAVQFLAVTLVVFAIHERQYLT